MANGPETDSIVGDRWRINTKPLIGLDNPLIFQPLSETILYVARVLGAGANIGKLAPGAVLLIKLLKISKVGDLKDIKTAMPGDSIYTGVITTGSIGSCPWRPSNP